MTDLIKRLRCQRIGCGDCPMADMELVEADHSHQVWSQLCTAHEAADAITELLKAAKAMHTWIFINTGDEQAAYDECGLTDKMNAMLGYGGRYVAEPPKEET